MLEQFIGQKVTLYLGTVSGISDSVKGEVVEIKDSWLKLQSKTNTELINLNRIIRISVKTKTT
jgi:hypothetical protein